MKICKKIIAIVLAVAICVVTIFSGVNTINARAATRKVTTSGKLKSAAVPKKAPVVKKGTSVITMKKASGFVKFKAPSTKTYKFTVSKLSNKSKTFTSALVSLLKIGDDGRLDIATIKTYGGKNDTMFIASNKVPEQLDKAKKKDYFLVKRTGSVKLKKGDTIYLYAQAYGSVTTTYTLNIK